jgi:hypothetical protein
MDIGERRRTIYVEPIEEPPTDPVREPPPEVLPRPAEPLRIAQPERNR